MTTPNTKKFWQSKMFWTNIVAAGVLATQAQFGWVISPEVQAGVITAVNMLLRFVTKEEITW